MNLQNSSIPQGCDGSQMNNVQEMVPTDAAGQAGDAGSAASGAGDATSGAAGGGSAGSSK